MSTKLGEWLRQTRESKHLSQRDLAKLAGISQSSIQSIEARHHVPKASVLVALAKALGESPEKVLRLAEVLPRNPGKRDPYFETLEILWELTPDWKKRDIVIQLRAALEEQEREQSERMARRREGTSREDTSAEVSPQG